MTYGVFGVVGENNEMYFFNTALVVATAAMAYFAKPRHFRELALATLALDVLFLGGVFKMLFLHDNAVDTLGGIFMFGALSAGCIGLTGAWLYKLQSAEKTHE